MMPTADEVRRARLLHGFDPTTFKILEAFEALIRRKE